MKSRLGIAIAALSGLALVLVGALAAVLIQQQRLDSQFAAAAKAAPRPAAETAEAAANARSAQATRAPASSGNPTMAGSKMGSPADPQSRTVPGAGPAAAGQTEPPAAEQPASPPIDLSWANYPKDDRTYTWPEVQQELDRTREMRRERLAADEVLKSWYNYLSDPLYSASPTNAQHIAKLEGMLADHPNSYELLTALASSHLKAAWNARGTMADELVTAEGRQLMLEHAAKSKALLEQAIERGATDGYAHSLLLDVARIEGAPKAAAKALFEAGRAIDPQFQDLYVSMAEYLMPRWHGEPGEMERFAAESARRLPGDEGRALFMEIAYVINQYDPNVLFWGEYDRELLAQGVDVVQKHYAHTRNLTAFAALCAIVAQDQGAANRIRPTLRYDDAPRVWTWAQVAAEFYRWAESPAVAAGREMWLWGAPLNFPGGVFSSDAKSVWCPSGLNPVAVVEWDLADRRPKTVLLAGGSRITQLVVDTRQQLAVAAVTGRGPPRLLQWDLRQPAAEPVVHDLAGECASLALHPQQPLVAYAVEKQVSIYDPQAKAARLIFTGDDRVWDLRFAGDGNSLAVSAASIAVCDFPSGSKRQKLPSAEPANTTFAVERVLDMDDKQGVWTIGYVPGSAPVSRRLVRIAPDGGLEILLDRILPEVSLWPRTAALSADRQHLAILSRNVNDEGGEDMIQVVNLSTRRAEQFTGHPDHIGSLAFSPDGRQLLSVGLKGSALRIATLAP